jgi:hypothetical protein
MTQEQTATVQARACPACGEQLHRDGDLLRCEQHGLFFRYGPSLLVHVARTAATQAPLMPWQTVQDQRAR